MEVKDAFQPCHLLNDNISRRAIGISLGQIFQEPLGKSACSAKGVNDWFARLPVRPFRTSPNSYRETLSLENRLNGFNPLNHPVAGSKGTTGSTG